MGETFTTAVLKDSEKDATGIEIPEEVITALGKGKKPPVKVTLNGYTYRTTVAVMGGKFLIPLSAEHRNAAGVQGGEVVEVTIELDTEPRTVTVPDDLAQALSEAGVKAAFDALAYSVRKEHVRQVESAKTAETRSRRIARIVANLSAS